MLGIVTLVFEVDEATGEVVSERSFGNEYRIKAISRNSDLAFERMQDGVMDLHRGEKYAKIYGERLGIFLESSDTTDGECRMLLACACKCLKYGGRELSFGNNIPVAAGDLIAASGMPERSGFRALSALVDKGILLKERDGRSFQYFLNPFLVVCGAKVDEEAFEKFKHTRWAKKPKKEK